MMILQHTLIVVSNGCSVSYLGEEDIVDTGVLIVVTTRRNQVGHEFYLVKLTQCIESGSDAEEVERLTHISRMRFVVVRDILVTSLYYHYETTKSTNVKFLNIAKDAPFCESYH